MATWLKQSTAIEIKLGPFVDSTDGFTAETGLTISQADVRLAKNAGDWAQKSETTTLVHEEAGWYRCLLDTTDTNTLGILIVAVNETGALPVWREFLIVAANIYDSLLGGGDVLDVSMTQILGTAVSTPATAGILDVNVKNIDNDAASASGTVTFPNATLASTTNITSAAGIAVSSLGANVITAASMAADASAEIADAVWDEDATGHQTQGSFGQAIGDPVADSNTIFKAVVSDATGATVGVDIATNLDATITSRMATYTQPTGFLAATFPGGTIANTTNITAGTITTATNVTTVNGLAANVITAASIAADASTEIRSLASGTADSGSTTTVVDSARTEADTDYWKGALIVFTSGNIAGQARVITAFDAGSDTITFAPATTQAVDTHTYEIWPVGDFLRPTTSGRTLDVSSGGEAGLDWSNIGSPTTAQNLSATNIDVDQVVASVTGAVGSVTGLTAATVHADLDDIQARLPAALVSGRIDASVGAMAAGVVTASAVATNAIDADAIAADAVTEIQSGLATASALSNAQSDIDDIQARLPAALTAGGNMKSDALALDGSTTAADRLQRSAEAIVFCVVGSDSTTTSIITSSMDPAAAVTDQFKGRIVIFNYNTTTANLRGQARDITASTAGGVLTVSAFSTAPVSGDTFTIT